MRSVASSILVVLLCCHFHGVVVCVEIYITTECVIGFVLTKMNPLLPLVAYGPNANTNTIAIFILLISIHYQLGAGLGLNGVLAHRLSADSVVITDGDSDAMVELRKNIVVNRRIQDNNNNDDDDEDAASKNKKALSAAQLIWGLESSRAFLENIVTTTTTTASSLSSSQFSIIIASDVIYAAIVIDPLWETVRTLLRKPGGEFWMAFAVRKVPVTIEFVLQKAQEYGFRYELVDRQQQQQQSNGDKDGVEGNPETGPVFIYVFRWDVEGSTEGVDNDSNTTPAIEES